MRQAEFRTFREAEKRLQMNYRSYSTGYHILISLLEVRIDYDADLVEMVGKQVAAVSKEISSGSKIDKEELRHRYLNLKRDSSCSIHNRTSNTIDNKIQALRVTCNRSIPKCAPPCKKKHFAHNRLPEGRWGT